MIIVGIDDTDIVGSRGTNQLCKAMVRELAPQWRCVRIVRHQLLNDPRVPYTSQNGSASISLEPRTSSPDSTSDITIAPADLENLRDACRAMMQESFIEGSDPGLCLLSGDCPAEVIDWGQRCQRDFVTKSEAYALAAGVGLHLESLGGTEDGVIGALAAIGLAFTEDDGRIVQLGEWPDDLSGPTPTHLLHERGVHVREHSCEREIEDGTIDVGKHLRPNLRNGTAVLFVEPQLEQPQRTADYRALKFT